MRFRKADTPASLDDSTTGAQESEPETPTDPDAALALAEAEAAAAEATAEAARARAEEIRLRSEASDGDPEESAESESGDIDSGAAPPGVAARQTGGGGRALRWAAAAIAMLSAGALVALSVLMVIHHRGVQAEQRQAEEYAAAAKQSVVTLMSLDFTSVDDDVQRIIDNSTGDFRKQFEGQAKDFATVAKDSKVITEATATAAAVESMTENDAVVLVTATSKVTNTSGAEQEPRTWRLTVNLTRDGDQIKMSRVEFAP